MVYVPGSLSVAWMASRSEMVELLNSLNREHGVSLVVATHDRELIRRVGRRAVNLDHGRVVEVA